MTPTVPAAVVVDCASVPDPPSLTEDPTAVSERSLPVAGVAGATGVAVADGLEGVSVAVGVWLGEVVVGLVVGVVEPGVVEPGVVGVADEGVGVAARLGALETAVADARAVDVVVGDAVAGRVRVCVAAEVWWVVTPGLGMPPVTVGVGALTEGVAELAVAASSWREA